MTMQILLRLFLPVLESGAAVWILNITQEPICQRLGSPTQGAIGRGWNLKEPFTEYWFDTKY